MFQYYCLNPISKVGLEKFSDSYTKTETAEEHRPDYLRLSQAERERLEGEKKQ